MDNRNETYSAASYANADNIVVPSAVPAPVIESAPTAPAAAAAVSAPPVYAAPDYSTSGLKAAYNESGAIGEELEQEKKVRLKRFRVDAFLAGLMMIVFTLVINYLSGYVNQIVMYAAIPDVVTEVFREGGLAAVEKFYYHDYCAEGGKYFALSGITDNIGYCFFVLLYFIPFAIFALCRGLGGKVFCRGERFSAKFLFGAAAVGTGVIYVWAYIYNYIDYYLSFMEINTVDLGYIFELFDVSSNAALSTPLGALFYFISTCIFAPLGEEFVCRGVMLGTLKKYGNWWAILITAALFGLMHMNFYQGPYAFLMGIVLGYVTVKTGSIWCAVIIHMLNNSYSVLNEFVYEYIPAVENIWNIVQILVMFGLMAVAVIFPIYFAVKGKLGLPKENIESPAVRVRAKTLRFCVSPLNLLFIAYCLLTAVMLIMP